MITDKVASTFWEIKSEKVYHTESTTMHPPFFVIIVVRTLTSLRKKAVWPVQA